MARRSDHSREEIREMALDAAQRLLDEQGSGALSTRKVASEIGYSAGSLYLVFRNLDDLCWQLNARTMAQLLERLTVGQPAAEPRGDTQGQGGTSPRDTLHRFALAYLEFARRWPNRWSLMFEHKTTEGLEIPDWLESAITRLFALVEEQLWRLQPQAPQESVQLASRTLWSAVHGITVLQLRDKLFLPGADGAGLMLAELLNRYLDSWQHLDSQQKKMAGKTDNR